ncbi:MAG: PTS sugar transporter subunit IIA [Actinomycetes bacterium]
MSPHLHVRVGVDVPGWQEAIRAACTPLVAAGVVEPRYVDACIDMVRRHGPYVVLAPGIALPHARPEDGVVGVGVSVAVLSFPVEFGHPENDPVDVVIAFGSPDSEQHIDLLAALAGGLAEGLADRLRAASDATEATKLVQEVIEGV